MSLPIVFMFSGQGSQYYGMGRDLYENNETFKFWMDKGSEIAEPLINSNLAEIIYKERENRFDPFKKTLYTHPAIFIFEYALFKTLENEGVKPDYFLGYSIGEYASLACAGVISFEDGIKLLVQQAQLLEEHSESAGMMAILESAQIFDESNGLFKESTLAGTNFSKHFVITDYENELKEIAKELKGMKIASQILPISHGFHSKLMDPVANENKKIIKQITFKPMAKTIFSSLKSDRISELNEINSDFIWKVTRESVAFDKTIEKMEESNHYTYIDLGPAATMANFVKYNLKSESESETFLIASQFGREMERVEKVRNI